MNGKEINSKGKKEDKRKPTAEKAIAVEKYILEYHEELSEGTSCVGYYNHVSLVQNLFKVLCFKLFEWFN